MKKVAIVQKTLVHYRVEFFNGLREALHREGVELTLIYGKMTNEDGLKQDEVELPWSQFVPNQTIKVGPFSFLWQPCLAALRGQDLVIVESANKLLLNYWLMLKRRFSRFKLAFWGHGRNLQDKPHSLANRFKSFFVKNCDWWFAYTEGVKIYLASIGYPMQQITAVQNAIDTSALRAEMANISAEEIAELRQHLGIQGAQVGIYCGGMYPEKQLDFLLEACQRIREVLPAFEVIFIGAGVDAPRVAAAAAKWPWIHYVGPKFGLERVKYFCLAKVFLMPGLVGLGILDAFALETPIATTRYPYHSPEIEYLEDGKNGFIVDSTLEAYTTAVVALLQHPHYDELVDHCRRSAAKYTIEQMVERYKQGILAALS